MNELRDYVVKLAAAVIMGMIAISIITKDRRVEAKGVEIDEQLLETVKEANSREIKLQQQLIKEIEKKIEYNNYIISKLDEQSNTYKNNMRLILSESYLKLHYNTSRIHNLQPVNYNLILEKTLGNNLETFNNIK